MPYEVATLLAAELAASGPTILVLEDVHWADEATLDVLRMLARRVEALPTLVVVGRDGRLRKSFVGFTSGAAIDSALREAVAEKEP